MGNFSDNKNIPGSETVSISKEERECEPADHGRGQGRVPSQSLLWQTGSSHHPTAMPIDDLSHPLLDQTSNCWSLEEHHYGDFCAVGASFKTDDPPLWSGLLSPSARADALRENRGLCLAATKTTTPSSIVGILSLMRAPI